MATRKRSTSSIGVDGTKIRRLRKEAGLSTRTLAEQCDVTQSHIINVELGYAKRLSGDTFGRLCDALGIPRTERSSIYSEDELADLAREASVA